MEREEKQRKLQIHNPVTVRALIQANGLVCQVTHGGLMVGGVRPPASPLYKSEVTLYEKIFGRR